VPATMAMILDYAPTNRKIFFGNASQTGWSIGGILAAVGAVFLLPTLGFRPPYIIGGALLVLVVPLMYRFLPESITYLLRTGKTDEAKALAARYSVDLESLSATKPAPRGDRLGELREVFARRNIRATIVFGFALFLGLLLAFGISTWLPNIMHSMGYPLGTSVSFLIALNVGNVIGILVVGRIGDRYGPKVTYAWSMVLAAALFGVLSLSLPQLALYVVIAAVGFGAQGTSVLLFSYIGTYYPNTARGTALGVLIGVSSLGAIVGPILGGYIAGSGLAPEWNFYIFAVVAFVAGASIVFVPKKSAAEARRQDTVGISHAAESPQQVTDKR